MKEGQELQHKGPQRQHSLARAAGKWAVIGRWTATSSTSSASIAKATDMAKVLVDGIRRKPSLLQPARQVERQLEAKEARRAKDRKEQQQRQQQEEQRQRRMQQRWCATVAG